MAGARYAPRRFELAEMIDVLVKEHKVMKEKLREAREGFDKGDYDSVSRALNELEPVFRQHIADEESQILRLLVDQLGVRGASEEIKVFQQHRPIHQLMERVAELAAKPAEELRKKQDELEALFDDHTMAEEGRVFPKALALSRRGGRKDSG